MYKLALTAGLFLLSGNALAAYTESLVCDTCDYNKAVRLAEENHDKLTCQVSGLSGGELEQFGVTTYQCDSTAKDIIITNPVTRTGFKFKVTAAQQSEHSPNARVIVRDTSMTRIESQALEEFYQIDAEVRAAVRVAGAISTPLDSSPNTFSFAQTGAALSSASSAGSCKNHPSIYLTDTGKKNVEREMHAQITERLGDSDWEDFSSTNTLTGGGLQVGKDGAGASLSFTHEHRGVSAIKAFGGFENALVFKVIYDGEITIDGQRTLFLDFQIRTGSSRIDGFTFDTFTSGRNVQLPAASVSNCLLENLANIPGATVENIGSGGASTGTGGGTFGTPVFGGGGGSCGRRVKYKTCSTANGVTSCTESSLSVGC